MTTGRFSMRIGVVLESVGVLLLGIGCAAKRVAVAPWFGVGTRDVAGNLVR